VLEYLNNKTQGFFLDIGCCYPKTINNTYLLEKEFGWDGISIDIHDFVEPNGETWTDLRKSKQIIDDALKIDYSDLLRKLNAPKEIDFLSMDLEPPDLTYECLKKIPFDEYTFKVILFEIDDEREPNFETRKKESRELIQSKGYIFLGNIGGQDDFYINNSLNTDNNNVNFFDSLIRIGIPESTIKYFNKNL
jgi:hypothetical protein